jgi:diacylglycerol O-acyltransferase
VNVDGSLSRRRPASPRSARPSRVRLQGLWDVGAGLLVFGGYLAAAARTPGRLASANADARRVLAAEQWLGLAPERSVNRWTASHPVAKAIANYDYAVGYLVSTLGTAAWLRLAKRPNYPRHVLSLLGINATAIGVFAAFPVTPPRLLADAGFVDTVAEGGTVGSWSWGSALIAATANEHAAMPSLHVAWTTWVAATLHAQGAPRWLRWAAVLHVGTTTAVIVMTGNHWWLDALAGVAVAVIVDRAVAGALRVRREVRSPYPPVPRDTGPAGFGGLSACSLSSR